MVQLYPNQVHITAAVVQYTTSLGRVAKGVTTSWFSDMDVAAGVSMIR